MTEVCDKASQGEVVACCNLNAPGQIVIGGHKTAVERAIVLAESGRQARHAAADERTGVTVN